jgi:hypothetical protein
MNSPVPGAGDKLRPIVALSALVAVAALALAGLTSPADAAINVKVKKACKGDYQRLCPNYKVGSSQLRACMEAKQFEISSGCVDALIDSGEVNRSRGKR